MISKETRRAAFESYAVEVIDGKTYAVVTCDFGRRGEIRIETLYQRLTTAEDKPRKMWWGTTLAADRRFEERQRRLEELRAFRDGVR